MSQNNPLSEVASFSVDRLTAAARGPSEVALTGEMAMRDPVAEAGPFFRRVHDAAAATLGGGTLTVDVTGLAYVNSSGLRVFLDWIAWIGAEAAERRYTLHFRLARGATWQAVSFPAIAAIGGPVVRTETV